MKSLLGLVIAVFIGSCAFAQQVETDVSDAVEPLELIERWEADRTIFFPANEANLSELIWIARPLVIFADSPNDPLFRRQLQLLEAWIDDLAVRDVIVLVDTDRANPSDTRLQLRPNGFMMVLIDKSGRIALRKPVPWDVRELSRSIDKMPLRQQEIDDRRGG